jgi:hypothetical protein
MLRLSIFDLSLNQLAANEQKYTFFISMLWKSYENNKSLDTWELKRFFIIESAG